MSHCKTVPRVFHSSNQSFIFLEPWYSGPQLSIYTALSENTSNIPKSFFEFICYALKNADETLVDDDYKEKDIYNKALN